MLLVFCRRLCTLARLGFRCLETPRSEEVLVDLWKHLVYLVVLC